MGFTHLSQLKIEAIQLKQKISKLKEFQKLQEKEHMPFLAKGGDLGGSGRE
ncbi:MAG: hypothetical protein CM15mP47_3140 [Methanobacteriota archaeon]|nr:MAG: hypothetical protein CM15mP47_3140 [Euryarchaeota archaeon]